MAEESLFPSYIQRTEEGQIREVAAQVQADGTSRVVLLYGDGGVGKTCLVRQLASDNATDTATVWVGPIDIDDSEFWLLSNLEKYIADRLDPGNQRQYFAAYLEHLSRLPRYTRPRIGHETVISHLSQIKKEFLECYRDYIRDSGKTVVIMLDTVEAIRGIDLLVTLTQLIKTLPGTLFILSGRPQPRSDERPDPITRELEDPYEPVKVTSIWLDDFTRDAAMKYLNSSGIADGLDAEEKTKLAHLTHGHPLWLAFTISYLGVKGLPEEAAADVSLEYIEENLPYQGDFTKNGLFLREEFNRRLVASYRETDFWHEAIKRLAVARESVSRSIWRRFMDDRPLPENIDNLDDAWEELLHTPWIRPRANRQYVTLHDVVAEELARRIMPIHDQGRQWRHDLWSRAADVYAERIVSRDAELADATAALEETQRAWDAMPPSDGDVPATEQERQLIDAIARLDVEKRELSQFKAVRLNYQLLCDFTRGSQLYLELHAKAKEEHDILFQELLALEMERFLPGRASYPIGDLIGEVVEEFRAWLKSDGQSLDELPPSEDHRVSFRLNVLRGNAYMRIPGQVRQGLPCFNQALLDALELDAADRHNLIAKAYKELGFYHRNAGDWEEADEAYRNARDTISQTLSAASSDDDREEMASIQTNWAYVKGLRGSYRDGANLVESAVHVRRRLNRRQEEGISLSVSGEVYRYERRFHMAWRAYQEAERIFDELRSWPWLGLVYQEKAICLFQALQDEIALTTDVEPADEAKRLIGRALELCRNLAVRGYPSALNRAGRILGQDDPSVGLDYLAKGIESARQLSDGWFWFANLIEFVELCFRVWYDGGERAYLDQIDGRRTEIEQAMAEYEFLDLKGRWNVLQGHLSVHKWLEARDPKDPSLLDDARRHFAEGFVEIAERHVGSSGAAATASEFRRLRDLVWQLPEEIREQWHEDFRRAWSAKGSESTMLLARLEELY